MLGLEESQTDKRSSINTENLESSNKLKKVRELLGLDDSVFEFRHTVMARENN